MTDLFDSGVRALRPRHALHRTARLALLALPLGLLVACGGGESEESPPAPTMVRVDTPPRAATAAGIASTGIELSGALNYQVWGNGDVAAGSGAMASAQVAAVPDISHTGDIIKYNTTITFVPAAPFTTGLKIADAHSGVNWLIQDGGGTWISVDATDPATGATIKSGGVTTSTWPASHTMWSGSLLSLGNYFVFCSAGAASASVSPQAARSGAQVAISSRFEPMDNLAPLYGKSFYRFDCAGTTNKTTFGDGQGHLSMAFDGLALSEAQTVQAFSTAGYTPATGQTIKRRAYSIVINGVTRYAIVALDNRGSPYVSYASVLFQPED